MYFIMPTTTLQAIFYRFFGVFIWAGFPFSERYLFGWITSQVLQLSHTVPCSLAFLLIFLFLLFSFYMPSVTVKRYYKIFNFPSFDFKAFLLLLFEWVSSWCSVTRAVIFFLMNSLFEEKCNSGCPKMINKFRSNSWNSFGWKNNSFEMLH